MVYHFQDKVIKDTEASICVAHILFLGSFILGQVRHHGTSSLMESLVQKESQTFDQLPAKNGGLTTTE